MEQFTTSSSQHTVYQIDNLHTSTARLPSSFVARPINSVGMDCCDWPYQIITNMLPWIINYHHHLQGIYFICSKLVSFENIARRIAFIWECLPGRVDFMRDRETVRLQRVDISAENESHGLLKQHSVNAMYLI